MSDASHEKILPFESRLATLIEVEIGAEPARRAAAAALSAAKSLSEVLVELGMVSRERLDAILVREFGLAAIAVSDLPGAAILGDALPVRYLTAAQVLPIAQDEQKLTLAMVNPYDDFAAQAEGLKVRLPVSRALISKADFVLALAHRPDGARAGSDRPA